MGSCPDTDIDLKLLSAHVKTNLDGDKNNPKISGASVTNFNLTLAFKS